MALGVSSVCAEVRQAVSDPSRAIQDAHWLAVAHSECHQAHRIAPPEPETVTVATVPPNSGMGDGVERWRDEVAAYFGSETNLALCVMAGESGGNPDAYNPSGASGLFQIMPFWAYEFGISPSDLFDPGVNIDIAYQIRLLQGWEAWSAYRRCS